MAENISTSRDMECLLGFLRNFDVGPFVIHLGRSRDFYEELDFLEMGKKITFLAPQAGYKCDFYERVLQDVNISGEYTILVHRGEKFWLPRITHYLRSSLSRNFRKVV